MGVGKFEKISGQRVRNFLKKFFVLFCLLLRELKEILERFLGLGTVIKKIWLNFVATIPIDVA